MQAFLSSYGFLDWVLRAALLAAQSLAIGGVAFFAFILFPLRKHLQEENAGALRFCGKLLFWSAFSLSLGKILAAAALAAMLAGTLQVDILAAAKAQAVIFDLLGAAVALALALAARRMWVSGTPRAALALTLPLAAAHVGVTHAASRTAGPIMLIGAEMLHLFAVAIWIGGMPYFIAAFRMSGLAALRRSVAARFSFTSFASVIALIASGILMASSYTGSLGALVLTNYGLLICMKVILLSGLLCFGAANFFTARRLRRNPSAPSGGLTNFAEVEAGVGLIVIVCAAALASSPLAVDVRTEKPSLTEVAQRFVPRWPHLVSPAYEELTAGKAYANEASAPAKDASSLGSDESQERNAADIAWSEINHQFAGVLVFLMGLFALLEHFRRGRVSQISRHWPLLFVLLAAVLVMRSDEQAWPLGKIGYFESLGDAQVAQHRLLIVLIALFGIFEWRARLKSARAKPPSYVFPIVVGIAAAFLMTHYGHVGGKEEVLMQISHAPIALLGVAAASARWLEIRMPGSSVSRAAATVWPITVMASGVLLVFFYREA